MTPFTIAPVREDELEELLPLMRAYCDFYSVFSRDEELRAVTRGLQGSGASHGLQLVARDTAGSPSGFATLLFNWSTTSGGRAAVLEDLYVTPQARRQGLARALIERCRAESGDHGARELSWITRPDNLAAQSLYDRLAVRDQWVNYRIDLADAAPE
jgi:ribosomal protein S18 acetylase RimI-like enzyme